MLAVQRVAEADRIAWRSQREVASFYVYNDEVDVDALVPGAERARELFGAIA